MYNKTYTNFCTFPAAEYIRTLEHWKFYSDLA